MKKKLINKIYSINSLFVCVGVCLLLFTGCVRAPVIPTQQAASKQSLQQLCLNHQVQWEWDAISQVVSLDLGSESARILIGSAIVMIGEKQIVLSEPIRRKRNMIMVPPDFERRVLGKFASETTFNAAEFQMKPLKVVVLDAGHGGKDPGALGYSKLNEKDLVLDIVNRVKRELIKHGIKVILTRKNDQFISLPKRTEIASKVNADLFVSVHANASTNRSVQGFEVFYFRGLMSKDLKEQQRIDNHRHQFKNLDMKKDPVVSNIVADMLYAHKQAISPGLAKRMSHKVSKDVRLRNRGAKDQRFHVLRNTLIPAVLVEVGFVSNKSEERRLKVISHRQSLAESIAKSILQFNYDS